MTANQRESRESEGQRPRFPHGTATMWICAIIACVLAFYFGSYYYLSRRGVAEAARYGMRGILYVPADEVFATEDLSGHYIRCTIYAPLNWIDQNVFGGPAPVSGIRFHLSR